MKKLLEKKNELIKLLERQKISRNEIEVRNSLDDKSNQKDIKIKNLSKLCKICVLWEILLKIKLLKKKNTPDKFISIQEEIQISQKPNQSKDDEAILCLGILGQILEDKGILAVIEKEGNQIEENKQEEASTSLQFLVNLLINKSKFEFHFDLGEEKILSY